MKIIFHDNQEKNQSTDEDYMIGSKTQEQLINVLWGEIFSSIK